MHWGVASLVVVIAVGILIAMLMCFLLLYRSVVDLFFVHAHVSPAVWNYFFHSLQIPDKRDKLKVSSIRQPMFVLTGTTNGDVTLSASQANSKVVKVIVSSSMDRSVAPLVSPQPQVTVTLTTGQKVYVRVRADVSDDLSDVTLTVQ